MRIKNEFLIVIAFSIISISYFLLYCRFLQLRGQNENLEQTLEYYESYMRRGFLNPSAEVDDVLEYMSLSSKTPIMVYVPEGVCGTCVISLFEYFKDNYTDDVTFFFWEGDVRYYNEARSRFFKNLQQLPFHDNWTSSDVLISIKTDSGLKNMLYTNGDQSILDLLLSQ